MLLDFLVGESVDTLARKNRLPPEHVEHALRAALSSYGFQARPRACPCLCRVRRKRIYQSRTRKPIVGANPTLRSASWPGKSS